MPDLISSQAKICYTGAGMMILQDKVLLVKHKKLGIWLNPGGHIEENELPHQAAEREFWEETGIKVQAQSSGPRERVLKGINSEYLPVPLVINLHWVSRENYDHRLGIKNRSADTAVKWERNCEQHLGFLYLVKPLAGVEFKENVEETLGIAWFSAADIDDLETTPDMKQELKLGFTQTKQ